MQKDVVPDRIAGRVIPMTLDGEVLLIKGHDADNLDYSWWFTVGGGTKEKETVSQCAVRELYEETGIKLQSCNDLMKLLIVREGKFSFTRHTVYQRDYIYIALLDEKISINTTNFTLNEKNVIDDVKWWNISELYKNVIEGKITLYPYKLEEILMSVHQKLLQKLNETSIGKENKKLLLKNLDTWEINDYDNSVKVCK
ncbi:NUDIX domain-containing protein [Actinomyces sp. zg-332]|uniref:NUDIX hydrolase n=1 Tax=Actinomyces sp. zg-332 TaxID=2708340 RepID=UPI0014236877|nr:NUDIX domain-containing protein [Actinomyces sp. zg-332]QPK94515.1 NUDIX domain-containing protein [Actinomyces sp. zg-332]